MANGKMMGKINFGTMGIALGIAVVVISVVWVTILSLGRDGNPDEIMWVG